MPSRGDPGNGRRQAGDPRSFRGVDSSVAAVLLHRAIGRRLTCVFVDNGLLRLGEAEKVRPSSGKISGWTFVSRGRGRRLSRASRGGGSGTETEDHRPDLHRGLREGGPKDQGRGLPRPGDALSGPHRIPVGIRRPQRRDQVPPQRGGTPQKDETEARRAAEAPLQGRGPAPRKGARDVR